jgi:tyrocidine synthetase-3
MIIKKFEEQVKSNPKKVAVKTAKQELTYEFLNSSADKVSNIIRKKYNNALACNKEEVVALLFEHGIHMILGTIAALKSGKVYVPFDPSYPLKRLVYMLEDSGSHMIITNNENLEIAKELVSHTDKEICIMNIDEIDYLEPSEKIQINSEGKDVAYILYTSGSTGKPKGVVQTQEHIMHFIKCYTERLSITKEDKMTLFSAFSHDAAIMDIYGALLNGATLYPLNIKKQGNINEVARWLQKEEITIWHSVPTLYRYFVNTLTNLQFENLRFMVLGGEAVVEHDIVMFRNLFNNCKLMNLYGQTESSYNSSQVFLPNNDKIKITLGDVVADTEIVVIDENGEEVSTLQIGEIAILSDNIALGYWNDKEKTEEVFEYYPDMGRIYWTGDLGRLLEDGHIEFVGRKGAQVKIRGFRVELGEIESRLLTHKDIKEAVVLGKKDATANDYLCAYMVSEVEVDLHDLRQYLSQELPEYMIPSYFIKLEKMPLTPTGKVDRRALPEPSENLLLQSEYEAPRNDLEEKLVDIWREVLGPKKIGINSNFFELGGHSLKATTLILKIHQYLNVEVDLGEIFRSPTIKSISEYIEKKEKSIYEDIKAVENMEYYPVSSAQKRMYMLYQMNEESVGYNMPGAMVIEGSLDIARLETSFKKLISRHETLRTSFKILEEKIVQIVNKEVEFNIDYLEQTEKTVEELLEEFIRAFDLSKAPLLTVNLVKLMENKYLLMFDMHHIISDGTSMGILMDEFVMIYSGQELEKLKIQYKDFAAWQNKFLKSEEIKKQEEYWVHSFSNNLPVLNIPTDFVRPSMQSFEGDSISFKLDNNLTNNLNNIAKETGSTMYMLLLSGVNILLSKYSGQEDIIVGSPVAGRQHADLNRVIGMFVNTLAMRNYPKGIKSYRDFLKEVKENSLKSYENQQYQFEELVNKLNIPRDISRNPLFDVMFIMQNMDNANEEIKELEFKQYIQERKTAKVDLTFTAKQIGEELLIDLEYCTKLFKRETIERMKEHFVNILEETSSNLEIKLKEINILPEEEKHKLLYDFNNTYVEYDKNKTIYELFEEQVERTPENIAVVFQEKKLTYRELNEKSNQLARVLIDKGVQPDTIVGIMVERSLEMIIGILGILKSGGAYLPIDLSYPEERIDFMLEDSNIEIIVTQKDLTSNLKVKLEMIEIDEGSMIQHKKTCNIGRVNAANNLAYVIYTSGSTGTPKGVMVEHAQVNNFIQGVTSKINFEWNQSILCLTTICFDIFALETLVPLVKGLKVVVAKENEQIDAARLNSIIINNKIDMVQSTPSRLKLLMSGKDFSESMKTITTIMIGGEAFPNNLLKELRAYGNLKIYNMYGPTETTVWSTIKDLTTSVEINIGKPISNTEIYILGKNNELQPLGVAGEMYIAGDGVARGYVNRLDLTKEKFLQSPFVECKRMYRTGDVARWLPSGEIEYLGRTDNQVKIRGYRIELGDIETQLVQYESVKEAIVLVKEDDESKVLCAYVIAEKELTIAELRKYLSNKLPEYMIPSYFIQIDKMPLTPNGKVDRKMLDELHADLNTGIEYEAPRNNVEEKLVHIWSDTLKVDNIGINDNFFNLGGHSLKATSLISKIHKEFNVEIPLIEIFKSPTLKEMSEYIRNSEKNIYEAIEPIEEKEYYEVSSAQKRMYMLYEMNEKSVGYNMPGAMFIEGDLDKGPLEEAFKKLISRHETLRTSFKIFEEKVLQIVNKEVEFNIDYLEKTEKTVEELLGGFIRAFDLSKAPLLRVNLVKLMKNKYLLMFDMHHIISDGTSMEILMDEFVMIYSGQKLEKLKIQYKDFSAWQNKFLQSEEMKKQEEYWLQSFNNEIPVLNMPTDFVRPSLQSFEGDSISFKLGNKLTNNLNIIAKDTGSTMYMILLSGVNILLAKYSGQEDIIVGSPVAGRPHADLSRSIGMFVNTLVMRNHPKGIKSYRDFLKEVKENSLKSFENQQYQFEELVNKLNIPRDISRNPLFDVMFIMQNMDSKDREIKELAFKPYKQERKTAKVDLTFTAIQIGEEVLIDLEYCTKLFKRETIERMKEHFVNILEETSINLEIKLKEINILPEEEKHKLLYNFNNTYLEYDKNRTIYELFEEQALRTPENIAVVFQGEKLTYRELNEKSNQLARVLIDKGVQPNTIVGIMVERSLEMIIGILGILKSGGAYLPIDLDYPQERINYMLEDSKVAIIVTQKDLPSKLKVEVQSIEIDEETMFQHKKTCNVGKVNDANNLAYVIYTSGSTGTPKGVMVEHAQVNNFIQGVTSKINFEPSKSILCLTTICFDIFALETLVPLVKGLKVVVAKENEQVNAARLNSIIINNKIDMLQSTPSRLKLLMSGKDFSESMKTITTIMIGGETFPNNLLKELRAYDNLRIYNMYGPTETTVWSTIKELTTSVEINIGKPISNTQIYILGKNNEVQPLGVAGEMYIAGDGVTRGYNNRLDLTEEKFLQSPFVECKRMYRTGDLARWLPSGEIEYLGRTDNQVKIRGYRIELGDIETQLVQYESVKEAIVLVKEDDGSKVLCAYVTSEKELTIVELRRYLSNKLPEYMIPSYLIQIEKIPLTPNGKVDRKMLDELQADLNTGIEYEAPRNEVEEKLVHLWSDILKVDKIGINDNFFNIGGHSLKATLLISKIHKEFNVEIPLIEIFKAPTLKEMADYIRNSEKNIYEAIESIEEKEYYEVSSAQKRMYMLYEMNEKSVGYNMPGAMLVEGNLDKARLEEAFKKLISRHETLRTSFKIFEEKVLQKVNKEVEFKVDYLEETEKTVEELLEGFIRNFDLSKAPLLRVNLVKLMENKYLLMFDMHHIISDGTSMGILTNEFVMLYEGQQLEKLKIQYKDFASWQNKFLQSEEMKKQEEYWLQSFSEEIPVLNMPADFVRASLQSFEGDNISFKLDNKLTNNLNNIAKETGSTMYMILLSGVNILLSKYSGQEDIIVGSPVAGRPHSDLNRIIGMFVNTLAMRNYPKGIKRYRDFLKEVKENSLKSYENQQYQFEELVNKLNISRDISRNPLFDVMFIMQNMDNADKEIKELEFKQYIQARKTAKVDLTFTAKQIGEEVLIDLEYCAKLFKRETIERMKEHFVNILEETSSNLEIKLKEINILPEEEKHKLLYDFNNTYVEYDKNRTIYELFEEQVERTPENIAVLFQEKKLTYRELNEKSNQLARVLIDKGVQPDTIVGIMVERSLEMIIGILGILKSGGAYLPIDLSYPAERIDFMLKDSNIGIIVTQKNLTSKLKVEVESIEIDEDAMLQHKEDYNIGKVNNANNLAYVIYTSGSTGTPKGVMVEHAQVNNFIQGVTSKINFEPSKSILCLTTICFDIFALETLVPLVKGLKVVVAKENEQIDAARLNSIIINNKIDMLQSTPSRLKLLMSGKDFSESMKTISTIMIGGEAFPNNLLKELKIYDNLKIYNMYGPTETTVWSTIKELTTSVEINIGKPISNTQIYILGKNNEVQPLGVAGEMYIAGDGVTRGYVNRLDLTEEKFSQSPSVECKRMYRTGDLARWLPNGDIEYLGRTDNQVKIRGYRIELGDIETQLVQYESVKEAMVLVKEDDGSKVLCAYLTCEKELTIVELRRYLSNKLPEYMIPSYFIQIEKMPLTPNGKVDRKMLDELQADLTTGIEYEAPRNEVEEKLVQIWSDILKVDNIGINDNFFNLGGHSLKATSLIAKIYKEFNVEIPLMKIFKAPTLKDMSEYITNSEKSIYESILPVEEKEYYEVSSAQKRMYMLYQFNTQSLAYNMHGNTLIEGKLSIEKLEEAFTNLVERHEAFRTSFEILDGDIVQKINKQLEFKIDYIKTKESNIEEKVNSFIKPFILSKAPLLRVGLINLQEDKYILMFDMHHIISDGVSMGVLIKEFADLYSGKKLKKHNIQYKDYAAWQNKLLKSEKIKNQEKYWLSKFDSEIPVLNMRTDYERGEVQNFSGDRISFTLQSETVDNLKNLADKTGSTMYMILLSIYNVLLHKYTEQEDIIVGSPIAGRVHEDLQNVIGVFINTLAMRNHPKKEKSFKDFLMEVKQNTLEAYENADYQFDDLVFNVNNKGNSTRNPIFSTMFILQNMEINNVEFNGLKMDKYNTVNNVSMMDITLIGIEDMDSIIFNLEYCTKLFKKETMEQFIDSFIKIVDIVSKNEDIKIEDIQILDKDKKYEIVTAIQDLQDSIIIDVDF